MLYSIIVRETLNTHIPTLRMRFLWTLFLLNFRFCTLFAFSLLNPFTTPFYMPVEVVFASEDLVGRCAAGESALVCLVATERLLV